MHRVFVVDDHQVLVDGIRALLGSAEDVSFTGAAYSGEEALERLEGTAADVVLLDIGLPGMDGLDTCAAIKGRWPELKVIALSMHDGHHMISGMLERGASGYLLKNVGREELLEAITTVCNGGTHLSSQATDVLVEGLRNQEQASGDHGREPIVLTEREQEVLMLIADEHTTSEIADRLGISVNTVESHRRHLLEKLGARNSAGLIRNAMRSGLLGRD